MERRDTQAISRKQHSLMPAPAQRIPIQRRSPDCNMTGGFTQSCHSYSAPETRKGISWTDVSWRGLEVEKGSQERASTG